LNCTRPHLQYLDSRFELY